MHTLSRPLPSLNFSAFRVFLLILSGLLIAGCDGSSEQSIEALMERAIEQRDQGKLRASAIDLKSILQREPKNVEARLLLGQLYLDIGDSQSAEKELNAAAQNGGQPEEITRLLGQALLLRSDYKTVLDNYIVKKDSSAALTSQTSLLRGHAYNGLGQLDDAEEAYKKALSAYKKDINEERPHLKITQPPELVEGIIGLAEISMARKKWDDAGSKLDRAKELDPQRVEILTVRGELAFQQENYSDSEISFQAAFDRKPYDLKLQVKIARAQILLNKDEKAITNLDAVLKRYPNHATTIFYRSLVALRTKDYERAKTLTEKLLKINPNYVQAYMIAGSANYGLGNFEQAYLFLKRYLNRYPMDSKVQELYGLVLMRVSRPRDALSTLQPLSAANASDTRLLKLVATAAAISGNLEMAGSYLKKALAERPDDVETQLNLARVKFATGEHEDGVQELEDSVKKAPNFLKGQYTLLNVYLRAKDFDNALKAAKELQEKDPDSPYPLIGQALSYSGLREFTNALNAFKRAREISPEHTGAAFGAADIYLKTNNEAEARKIYEEILKQKPGHLATLMRLVALAQRSGDVKQYLALLDQAMDANPNAVAPRILAANNEIETNRPNKAISILKTISDENPNHKELLLILGRAQIEARKAGEAARTLEHLVWLRPNSPGAHFLLSQAYALLGNREKMHAALDQSLSLEPGSVEASSASVRGLMIDGKVTEAKQRLAAIKALHPDNRGVMGLDAWVAQQDDRPADAARIYTQMRKQADTESVVIRHAAAMWAAGEINESVRMLENWLAKNPEQFQAELELVNYYLILQQSGKALTLLNGLVERYPNSWIVLNNLANLLKENNPEQAFKYAERAHKLAPSSPPVVMTYVETLLLSGGDTRNALRLVQAIAKKYPKRMDVAVLLANVMQENGDRDGAVKLLNKFIEDNASRNNLDMVKDALGKL